MSLDEHKCLTVSGGKLGAGKSSTITVSVKSGNAAISKIVTGPQTLELMVTYNHDGVAAQSNTFALTFKDSGQIEQDNTYTGDQTYATATGGPGTRNTSNGVVTVVEAGQTLYVQDGQGNLQIDAAGVEVTDNTIYGTNDNDKIEGKSGNDALSGRDGNDEIDGGDGDDLIGGGAGSDIIKISSNSFSRTARRRRPNRRHGCPRMGVSGPQATNSGGFSVLE